MRAIPPLPFGTILLVEVGSTAHGTGLPGGEDNDELGVVIESATEVLGLDERGRTSVMQRTQPEGVRSGPGDTDRTLHSLRRFIRLAAGGNPSILMSFWAPVIHSTEQGDELRALGEAFVGRHVVPRYRGYMQSQAMRLLGTRGGAPGCLETLTGRLDGCGSISRCCRGRAVVTAVALNDAGGHGSNRRRSDRSSDWS